DHRPGSLRSNKGKATLDLETQLLRATSRDRAGIARRVDGEDDVAASRFNCTRHTRTTLLLHHGQHRGVYVAKLDRSSGAAGREGNASAALVVRHCVGNDLFAIDSRRDAAPLRDLGSSSSGPTGPGAHR